VVHIRPASLTFKVFLKQCGDDPRYELIDGKLRNLRSSPLGFIAPDQLYLKVAFGAHL
jgi:hypothetical protein